MTRYHLGGRQQLFCLVLILIDEPTRGVDPLIAYQLMYVLSQYVRKYSRMAMVTMSIPRSDIYPLLDRLTILFFGEVFYSGEYNTWKLAVHFAIFDFLVLM